MNRHVQASGITNTAAYNTPSTAVASTDPRPGFWLAVVGDAEADPAFVARKLGAVTGRVRSSHRLMVVVRGPGPAAEWAKEEGVGAALEMADRGRYGEPLWAMRVVSMCHGIVVFGAVARWWRLTRYARDGGVPVRVVEVPAQALRRREEPRPVPRAIVPVPGLSEQSWGDYFPFGVPQKGA